VLPDEILIAANNLAASYTIFPGPQLSVPPDVNIYRVRPGDTVYAIAQTFSFFSLCLLPVGKYVKRKKTVKF
jgi:spore germination protein YaaH